MICDRCGRLLNRATGRCPVCGDAGDSPPPPPVAESHPLEAERPISMASALAVLTPVERTAPARKASLPPDTPPAVTDAPPTGAPGGPRGVVRSVRVGRRRVDVAAYEGSIVLARRRRGGNGLAALTAGQAAVADPENRMISADKVAEADVREDRLSGRATIRLVTGERLALSWWGRQNRGLAVENLLADAFPGKVEQGAAQIPLRVAKPVALVLVLAGLLFGISRVVSAMDTEAPPPPPPAVTPVTLPPAEQAARAELAPACGPWQAFAAGVPAGERPNPAALRPMADGARPRFDAAVAANAEYAPARDEVAYLQGYARRPPAEVQRESLSRVRYAMDAVSAACARAAG